MTEISTCQICLFAACLQLQHILEFYIILLFYRISGLENPKYGRRDPPRRPGGTLYPQKLALTLSTSDNRSDGTVRSQTQTKQFVFLSNFTPMK
jgi:hypothetical protein